jgi:hypothetical protein
MQAAVSWYWIAWRFIEAELQSLMTEFTSIDKQDIPVQYREVAVR